MYIKAPRRRRPFRRWPVREMSLVLEPRVMFELASSSPGKYTGAIYR